MVSNRLSSSIPRARFLGMIIATAVSKLVDPADKVMNFDVEELEGEEAQRWYRLVEINDQVGDLTTLKQRARVTGLVSYSSMDKPSSRRPSSKPLQAQQSKIIAIEEVDDDSGEESDDEFVPYAKPDDDPSDSDEDPTLINRDKPSAPVYIIDLIKQLQRDDKPDVVELALKTAPALIRRKATFGTELSDNVQVLASALLNLRSPTIDDNETHSLRLQSLIACTISYPRIIAPWLASMYYEGDYSLAQRATILSALGMSAREVASLDTTPSSSSAPESLPFPSQQLPLYLAAIYAPTEHHATAIQHATMQPLALAAADKVSGPDALKIRTFSSRMAVEKRRADAAAARSKRIPRDLHALLASAFFLPLCSRLSLALSAPSTAAGLRRAHGGGALLDPTLLRLYLHTLTITLHALGPNAVPQLRECTRESLVLLRALTALPQLAAEPAVLPALLHLLLLLLDLNFEAGGALQEGLVTEFGEALAALVGWVGGLESRLGGGAGSGGGMGLGGLTGLGVNVRAGGGGGTEGGSGTEVAGMDWNVLAAAVLVKWDEIGRKFQGRMLALMGVQDVDTFG